ncbi:hypothetical protein V8F20_002842 [Naviculisporaceae sp. PSN 640]
MGRLKLAAAIGLAALASQTWGFFPGVGFDFWRNVAVDILLPRTISHADQTSQGITAFLEEHYGSNASLGFPPDLFRFSLPAGVRAARKAIVLANEGVDQAYSYDFERLDEKNYGPAHFDNEYLQEGQNHLLKLRSEMIALLLGDWSYNGRAPSGRVLAVDKARVWLGRQLHTLQDFYAHSNWVEMGRTTISPVIGRPGAEIYPKTPLNEPTCTDYCINPDSLTDLSRTQYFAMHTCYRRCFRGDQDEDDVKAGRICATSCAEPDLFCRVSDECQGHACSNNTVELARVTTGYYRTGDPNSVKPSGKCSHGGLNDNGARGIEGINKDSTMQTYSPHWFLHQTAARLAIAHTKQYLADLLQDWPSVTINGTTYPQPKLTDRHMRLLLGLNHGSLAFVIDRSRSMASALPAIKAAIRATVVRVQRLGHVPVRWVLVGYGQGLNTAVTVTGDINVFLQALNALAVDTTNSCLQERAYDALVLAARNSLERSQVFFFTDEVAANLPDPGKADNEATIGFYNEARELERTRLFDVHVIQIPNEPGYPYFEHPWPECRLTPTGTRTRNMNWLRSSISGKAFPLPSRANMILAMTAILTDTILDRYDTAANVYKEEVYSTGGRYEAVHSATREIVADGSMDFIRLFTSDWGQDETINGDITVQRPDGTTVKPLEDSDVVHVSYLHGSVGPYVALLIPDPQPGTWKITRSAPNTVLYADIASTISFSFSFVEWSSGAPHGGWETESFYPRYWYMAPWWTVKAEVNGPVESIDAFHFRARDSGAIIMALNLTRIDVFENDGHGFEGDHNYVFDRERVYMGTVNSSTFLWCGDFYATVSGTDINGIPFVRRDTAYFEDYEENWGFPRSPGCPPRAVPPVLVDISTFSSTSTTTSSLSPTIIPPFTTTSSSSSSVASSSLSSSWSSSSLPSSTASSTSGSIVSSTSDASSSVFSESHSSSVASITSASSSLGPSSSAPISQSSELASSLSSEVSSSQASSVSGESSTLSSTSESPSSSSSTSHSGTSSVSATDGSSMTQASSSVWSSSGVISTTVSSSEGGVSSSTTTPISSSSDVHVSSLSITGSSSSTITNIVTSSSSIATVVSSTQAGASSLTSGAVSASSGSASSSIAGSVSSTHNSSGSSSTMPSSTAPSAASSTSSSAAHSISSSGSSSGSVSSSVVSTPTGSESGSVSSDIVTSIVPSTSSSAPSSEPTSSTSGGPGVSVSLSGSSTLQVSSTSDSPSSSAQSSSGNMSATSTLHVSSSSDSSSSSVPSTSGISITTYTSGSITTSATALPVSESTSPTSTSSAPLPTTTRKCSCRAKKRKLKLKRDSEVAKPSVCREEL